MTLVCANENLTVGSAALYALVGFLIVLAVLALLVGIFYLSGYLFRTKALSKENLFEFKRKKKASPEPAGGADEDEETVAAITAAIAAILEEESGEESAKPDFVIRRIVRK